MLRTTMISAVALVALSATAALADSWMPPVAERFVDAAGDYHVLVSPSGKFAYARRGEGSSPLAPERGGEGDWKSDRTFPLREGDVLIAKGELPHRPMDVLVSARGDGFVALDHYANLGYGDVVVIVEKSGRSAHRRTLAQLFPKLGVDVFTHSVSSIWWLSGAWIDDARGVAVIVAEGGRVRTVELATGEVKEGGPDDIVRALDHPSAKARDLALELVRDKNIAGVEPALTRMLADENAALSTRLRVAVILASRGDLAGADLVVRAAREPLADGIPQDDHRYAVQNLPVVLGEAALPLLRDIMRGPAGDAWHSAQIGLASLGEKAVPTLLEMLAETGESPDYRGGAAHALKRIASRTALDGLLKAVGDENEYTANAAANAAIEIGAGDCADALLAHLLHGCTQDGRIAMFFERVAFRPAIPALIDLLARTHDDFDRDRARDALKSQTGEDFGDDVRAWRGWWSEHE